MKNKQNEYKNRITDTNHITMTPFLSQKIKLLSLISIILVLYIHSGFHDYPNEIQGMPFNFKLQDFISGKIGRCAVPLFYAISGYLFFLNLNNKNILWAKIKKRIMTLVVPYNLFHEPTLNIIRKLLIIILGHSSIGFAVNYLISPWIFTLLFIIIGFYFKKKLPKLYSICVGGR